mmetsp:Transcript_12996/g.28211  ORF Transcript_12996/g.28211 Transcript_12996/m.28211 type:complete len:297 (+) Transcript_12996:138-1028(+)
MNNDMSPRIVPHIMKSSRKVAECIRAGNGGGGIQSKSYTSQGRPPKTKTLARLVANRNWWEIETLLSSGSVDWIKIDEKGIITEESIVQFALRYRAPLHIIKLLDLRYPRCLTRPDSTGKFACHVASKYSATPNVMEYLVSKNKYAAGIQDPAGKTPIHYVAEFYASNNESVHTLTVNENMLQVVRILREAAPQSFNLEDNAGCNAIEYALENDADIRIIKTMQRTARDDWRALKAGGHGKKHEDLAKDVQHFASEARMKTVLSDVIGSSFRQDHGSSTRQGLHDDNFKSCWAKSA